MKKLYLLLPLIMLLSHVAMAADQPAIGYVDARKVLLESKLGKKNKADFEKLIKNKESTLAKEEEKLKAMQEAFRKDQLMMTDDQKQAKQKALAKISIFPGIMLACYIGLFLYFKSRGGYKAVQLATPK